MKRSFDLDEGTDQETLAATPRSLGAPPSTLGSGKGHPEAFPLSPEACLRVAGLLPPPNNFGGSAGSVPSPSSIPSAQHGQVDSFLPPPPNNFGGLGSAGGSVHSSSSSIPSVQRGGQVDSSVGAKKAEAPDGVHKGEGSSSSSTGQEDGGRAWGVESESSKEEEISGEVRMFVDEDEAEAAAVALQMDKKLPPALPGLPGPPGPPAAPKRGRPTYAMANSNKAHMSKELQADYIAYLKKCCKLQAVSSRNYARTVDRIIAAALPHSKCVIQDKAAGQGFVRDHGEGAVERLTAPGMKVNRRVVQKSWKSFLSFLNGTPPTVRPREPRLSAGKLVMATAFRYVLLSFSFGGACGWVSSSRLFLYVLTPPPLLPS